MKASKIDLKTYGFVYKLKDQRGFKKMVKKIREDNKIPSGGFEITKFDELVVKEILPRIPRNVNKNVLLADIKALLHGYNLSSDWLNFFADYILYDYWNFEDFLHNRQIITLDLGSRTESKEENERVLNDAKNFDLNPIAIFLPHFLTVRELLDYVEKNFKSIEKIQKKYHYEVINFSNKGGRQKELENLLRDKFIYDNQELNKKDLVAAVYKNFKQRLDHTYLNTIIRKQKKKHQRYDYWAEKQKNV
jgi:hypothetical protein